ncbi:unnamed protein product, partial [marine sediment metagenome]
HGITHRRHADFEEDHYDSGMEWVDARYIPTKWGGDADSPTLEIARTTIIDRLPGTIDSLKGDIDRPDKTGHYVSKILRCGATAFDKLYWHETIPAAGGDVLFYLRSGATEGECQAATWSSSFTDPSGSDISGVDADNYIQYKIEMTTNDIDYTPNVYTIGYTVKITYDVEGITTEDTVPFRWRGGWTDLRYPGYIKSLTRIYVYYSYAENVAGTINFKFENFNGDSDTFSIDTLANPDSYTEAFTGGKFTGDLFRLDITETSL